MRATSKVIMGATLVMVVCLAIVLALVLVLLAELYCTLLLRRKRHTLSSDATPSAFHSAVVAISPSIDVNSSSPQLSPQPNHSPSLPLASYYAQGVLQAPRSFLYPAISCKQDTVSDRKSQLHHHLVLDIQSNRSPQQIGLLSASPSSTSFDAASSPHDHARASTDACNEKCCNGAEHLVYISNPIYDDDASRVDTPFETPDSSPSRLETGDGSSGDDENEEEEETAKASWPHSPITTPPLTPMKKLPAEACSVSLRDARSLGTSGTDSVSDHNGLSSSSSGSPCTSPSW